MNDPRTVIDLSGADRVKFLHGLVTNAVPEGDGPPVYTALLTPQGKYLADFFVWPGGDRLLLDVAQAQAPGLAQRLSMYKLRADVTLTESDLHVHVGTGPVPADGFADPRTPEMGWRALRDRPQDTAPDLTPHRVAAGVPQAGVELTPDSYILEQDFERLNGVDFRKGCYVGQEVTARMKHKTALRKGLARVSLSTPVPVGTDILTGEKVVGTVYSQADGIGLAYLRFDRAEGEMRAGDAVVRRL